MQSDQQCNPSRKPEHTNTWIIYWRRAFTEHGGVILTLFGAPSTETKRERRIDSLRYDDPVILSIHNIISGLFQIHFSLKTVDQISGMPSHRKESSFTVMPMGLFNVHTLLFDLSKSSFWGRTTFLGGGKLKHVISCNCCEWSLIGVNSVYVWIYNALCVVLPFKECKKQSGLKGQ